MGKSIKKNYFYNLLYQIFAMIIPLITAPYISRILGAKGVGIFGYTTSITTYFILLGTIGIATYGQREIAYVQNDVKKRSQVFWELFISTMIAIILISSIKMMFFIPMMIASTMTSTPAFIIVSMPASTFIFSIFMIIFIFTIFFSTFI